MPAKNLIDAFKWHRQQGRFSQVALFCARRDVAANKLRSTSHGAHNVSWQKDKPGFAWIENTKSAGLRLVGFADELAHIDHKGWFSDADQDQIMRGAVWQLPARNGRAQYIAGYADPNIDGAAYAELSPIMGEKVTSSYDEDDGKREAARAADSIAERCAEKERDYQNAWQAGSMFAALSEDRKNAKTELRELLAKRRAGKSVIEAAEWGGAYASAIDAQARGLIDAMRDALENMTKLANGDGTGRECYGTFYSGDEDLRAAFCDGASLSSFPEL